jgi:hypothetical protein
LNPALGLVNVGWRVSSRCDANGGNCLEAGPVQDGSSRVAIRQNVSQDGPVVLCTKEEWEAFVAGVRAGDFDFFKQG